MSIIVISCHKDITEPSDKFWSVPTEESIRLVFRLSDSIKVDSLLAGEIQFRLDVSRTVDEELNEITVWKDWELGKLLLYPTNELYTNFDTTTYRFNYQPLDSLLDLYELKDGYKSYDLLSLIFPEYYNMRIFESIFEEIEGVRWVEPNYSTSTGMCDTDITLEIKDNLYIFIFSKTGLCGPLYWEVHVVNDQAELINKW